ncbi:D-alanine--D-alanine ligase [Kangiella sp. TOML190]|uniref:D-alanine--D-alanine ligase n=1 Tax=Kangiella sp. TOML190 TaxID=2931351 RepID=UPI00203FC9E1|nr:D-alanine--D-alanine ligase [Kangiella sp. TOML190]
MSLKPEMKSQYGKVAVLLGGFSAEREISLLTGAAVLKALIEAGVDAHPVDPEQDGLAAIVEGGFDRAWNALHGRGGEDGQIQSFLQLQGIAYTGCGVIASALSMDKLRTKLVWKALDLPVAPHVMVATQALSDSEAQSLLDSLGGSVMVKPIREGSSVGMARASNVEELQQAVAKASEFDKEVMLEQWVDGDEFTVAILSGKEFGDKALPSIHMITPNDFYDYEAKYQTSSTQYHCPSGLSAKEEAQLQAIALKAFHAVDGHGWSRVDFLRDKVTRNWVLLEVNTIPGMTQTSLVPKAAKVAGMSFESLVLKILDTSFIERK